MKQRSLKSNAVLNMIRQSCHMIFPLITYPYLLRILGSSNLGKYSFADSIISIALIFASLGIPTYAIREGSRIRKDREKITIFVSELFSFNLFTMVITYIVLFILISTVGRLQRDLELTYILSVTILANVIGRDWINSIYEDFLYITLRYCVFQAIAVVLVFAIVKKPDDYIKYTAIMLFANAGGYFANIFYSRRYVPLKITGKLNMQKHLKPLISLFCVTLAVEIYVKSDITILGFFRTDSDVGIYTAVSKIYSIVKTLLNAVITVFIPRLSYCLGVGDHLEYHNLLDKLRKVLCVLIFPAMAGLFCVSRDILWLLGGAEYIEGANALRILCVAIVFAVFGCYYSQGMLIPNRKDKYFLYATTASAIANIVLNFIVVPPFGMEGAAITTLIAEGIVVILLKKYSGQVYKKQDKNLFLSVGAGCIGIIFVCETVKFFDLWYVTEIILSIIVSVFIYITALILFKNPIMIEEINRVRLIIKKKLN